MTEHQLTTMLKAKYAQPEYAFMPQVRNGTGYSRGTTRTADGLAMGLYPSRGIHLHGFEIKVSRGDWKKELADPAKAESICQFCHYWWVVAPEGVVPLDELPATWGLLIPAGGKLKVVKQATMLIPVPLDITQIAAIFRAAQGVICGDAEIKAAVDAAMISARKEENERHAAIEQRHRERTAQLEKTIRDFEARVGMSIGGYRAVESADAFRFVVNGGLESQRDKLAELANAAFRIGENITTTLAAISNTPESAVQK